jgi:hypothetical protein
MAKKPSKNSPGTKRQAKGSSKTGPRKPSKTERALRQRKPEVKPLETPRPTVTPISSKKDKADQPVQNRNTDRSFGHPAMLRAIAMDPHSLVSNAFRHIKPTWRNYVLFADLAAKQGDENMLLFMKAYNGLTYLEKKQYLPEQICDLAGIQPGKLCAAVAEQVWLNKQQESVIFSSTALPEMLQATAFYGQVHGDYHKDRELFLRATGMLPDRKGTSVIINNSPQTANITAEPLSAGTNGFRPMDQRVIDLGKVLDPAEDTGLSFEQSDDVFEEISTEDD